MPAPRSWAPTRRTWRSRSPKERTCSPAQTMAGAFGSRAAWPARTSAIVDGIISLWLDATPGHDVGPARAIAHCDFAKHRGCGSRGNEALRLEGRLGLRRFKDGDDLAVEPFDHVARRALGCEEAVPHVDIDAFQAAFAESRHVGELRQAPGATDGDR